jgi:hypothetical protein
MPEIPLTGDAVVNRALLLSTVAYPGLDAKQTSQRYATYAHIIYHAFLCGEKSRDAISDKVIYLLATSPSQEDVKKNIALALIQKAMLAGRVLHELCAMADMSLGPSFGKAVGLASDAKSSSKLWDGTYPDSKINLISPQYIRKKWNVYRGVAHYGMALSLALSNDDAARSAGNNTANTNELLFNRFLEADYRQWISLSESIRERYAKTKWKNDHPPFDTTIMWTVPTSYIWHPVELRHTENITSFPEKYKKTTSE